MTGLAGHAFGSWRNRKSRQMWLRDFLPRDVKNIRIMTYGYDTNLTDYEDNSTILDYRRTLVEQLGNARRSEEVIHTFRTLYSAYLLHFERNKAGQ